MTCRSLFAIIPITAMLLGAAVDTDTFIKTETDWRAHRETSLRTPDGWLSVAGLFWLHNGSMKVGSDPHSDIVLPTSAPLRAGTFQMAAGVVTFVPEKGANV